MRFALNHITAPRLTLQQFIALAGKLDIAELEIRNDLPDLVGTTSAEAVKAEVERAGMSILTINAVYPFNTWTNEVAENFVHLANYAETCGAKGLVMCPLNDGTPVSSEQLIAALKSAKPILEDRGLTGFVEPLGFRTSSLRRKRAAIEAIDQVDGTSVYTLVHDTFHHYVAGEEACFPEWTGLVHISGVSRHTGNVDDLRDPMRRLVDADDRIDNAGQVRTLIEGGFNGVFSFEPFSPEVHETIDPEAAIRSSISLLTSQH